MKRVHSREEKMAEIQKSIDWHKSHIGTLEKKLELLKNPPQRAKGKVGMATVVKKAKEQGVSAKQLLEMIDSLEKSDT